MLVDNSIEEIYTGKEPLCFNAVVGKLRVFSDSKIIFKGTGNYVVVEEGVKFQNCVITFEGSNGLVFLSRSKFPYSLSASIGEGGTLYFGEGTFINTLTPLAISIKDGASVLVGNEALISFGVTIDAMRGDVKVGNLCWLGEESVVSGPCYLLGGCIVGAGSWASEINVGCLKPLWVILAFWRVFAYTRMTQLRIMAGDISVQYFARMLEQSKGSVDVAVCLRAIAWKEMPQIGHRLSCIGVRRNNTARA